MCAKTAACRLASRTPTVNSHGSSALTSAPRNQAKPTAAMSRPKRLSGRRHHANRPVPTNDQPTKRKIAASRPLGLLWSDARKSASATMPAATPSSATSPSARRRLNMSEELLHAFAGQLRLRHEAARPRGVHERPEVRAVATRGEDDLRASLAVAHELGADVEAVGVGELDVQEDDLRPQAAALRDGRRAVLRLAHDVESLRFQHDARARPEGRVVVDDQDRVGHLQAIVVASRWGAYTAGRTTVEPLVLRPRPAA